MAGSRIKGITIEIDGETIGLQQALQKVSGQARSLQGQLMDTQRLLKFNPGNVTLLAQRQKLLAAQVENTRNRLNQLKAAEAQVQAQFRKGKISEQQYQAFQREIVATEGKLNHFKGQLAEANAALKTNGSAASRLASDYKKSFNDAKSSVTNSFDGIKSAGKAVTTAGAGIAAGLGYAVKKAADFDSEMSRVGAISGASGKQMDALKATAIDLGAKTSLSADEVAQGMENMASRGFSVKQIISAMPGVISAAEASGQDLATTTDVMTSAMNAFGLKASDSGHVADVLAMTANKTSADINDLGYAFKYAAPVANGLGVSLEQLAAATGEMTDAGLSGEQAGTTLRASLLALANPSKTASAEMKKLGVNTKDSKGNFVGFPSIIAQFQKGMQGMTKSQKVAALAQVFGTESASGMLTVIGKGPAKFNALTKSLQNSNGASAKAAKQMKDNLTGALQNLGGAIESMMISIGSTLEPAIKKVATFISGLVEKFNSLPKSMRSTIAIVAAVAAGFLLLTGPLLLLIGFLPQIAAGFTMMAGPVGAVVGIVALVVAGIVGLITIIKNLWQTNESFRQNVTTVWQGIQAIFQTVMPILQTIVKAGWFVIQSIIMTTIDAIKNVIQGGMQVIANIFKLFGAIFSGNWSGAWDALKGIVSGALQFLWGIINLYFVGKLLGPLKAFGPAAKGILQAIWGFIKGIFTGGLGAIKGLVSGGFGAIKSIIGTLMKGAATVIKAIWNGIKAFLSAIWKGLKGVASSVWNGIKTVIGGAVKGAGTVIRSIWNGLKGFLGGLWNGLKGLASSVWNGIKTVVVGAVKGAGSVIRSIWNGIKSFLSGLWRGLRGVASSTWNGIKSAVIGVVHGMGNGIRSAWNGIKSATRSAFQAVKNFILGPLRGISLWNIGKNIIQGLINGIRSMIGAVWSVVSNIANGIKNKIKGALHIGSPSKDMRDEVGKMIGAGLIVGMDSTLGKIGKAASDMATAAIPAVPGINAPAVNSTVENASPAGSSGSASTNGGSQAVISLLAQQNELLMRLLNKNSNYQVSIGDVMSAAAAYKRRKAAF